MTIPDNRSVFTWVRAVFETELPQPTKMVLLALNSHTTDMGQTVWPSQKRLAAMCSMTVRALRTHIAKAEQAGWVRRVKLSEAEPKIAERNGRKPVKRKSSGRDWASLAYECCWPDGHEQVNGQQGNKVPPICGVREERRSAQGRNKVPPSYNKEGNTHHSVRKQPKPPTPKPVDNVDKLGVVKNDKMGKSAWNVVHHLTDKGWAEARKAAEGWDIHELARRYNEGVAKRGIPTNPDKAFPAWCSRYTKGMRL